MHEHRIVYEEVPGSRTTQQAAEQPQRERIAYEELQPGDVIQEGDEWRNQDGRWQPFTSLTGSRVQVRHTQRARRPHNITMMLREFANQAEVLAEVRADEKRLFDDLELLRSEYVKLQGERDELKTALRESHAAHEFTMKQGLAVCKERNEANAQIQALLKTITDNADTFVDQVTVVERERDEVCKERDLARSEVARLSTELWARRPLEDRVASLVEELANAREDFRKLVQTNAENADQFAEHTIKVVCERDEARAERDKLKGLIDDLLDEPTAKQVQDMLRTWATELDWSAGCFDSVAREQIDTIQKTLVAVIERIETMIHPEGGSDDE